MQDRRRSLWRWRNLFSGVTLDNLKFPAEDDAGHDLLWWSDYELPRLLSRGAWLAPEQWDGTFAWGERVHPREPLRAESIPHAFENEVGVVFHSPQVRAVIEQNGYAKEVQYLPTLLIEVCTEREIGRYYVANILACHRCVRESRWGDSGLELVVVQDIDELGQQSPLLRLQEIDGVSSGYVVVCEALMRLLTAAKLCEESDFDWIEWRLDS